MLLDPHLRQRQAKATKYPLPRAVVFLEPQRPDGDLVLQTPTTAASALCLPLQHRFYLVGLDGWEARSLDHWDTSPAFRSPPDTPER